MNLIKKSPEVYVAVGPIAAIGCEEIDLLRREVALSPKGRLRINLHSSNADSLHEMFIAIRPDSYIRPHKHLDKSESFHIVYGEVDIVIFEEDGSISQIVPLAANGGTKAFYYRISKSFFHTLFIRSDLLVIHEVTNGPFVKDATVFGTFAPEENDDLNAISTWTSGLADRVSSAA